jgi:hypothetical protein
MSLRNKSDVHTHLAAPRKHYSLLTMTPASESDATGDSSADDNVIADKNELTELTPVLVGKSKTLLTLPQTSKESA